MCIKRVTAWAFAGRNYDTEIEAVTAAIDTIGKRVVKDHSNDPGKGLLGNPDLPVLLLRHAELKAEESSPAKTAEGTRPEEPEGTRDHHPDCAFTADPEHGTCDCAGIVGTTTDKDGNL